MFILMIIIVFFLLYIAPLISASSNQSVYAGDTAIVTASINRSRLESSHGVIRLYINGCGFDDCEYRLDNISNTFSATCQVQNISYQTKVQFVVIDNGILCFNDSFINIKGIHGMSCSCNVVCPQTCPSISILRMGKLTLILKMKNVILSLFYLCIIMCHSRLINYIICAFQ